MYDSVARVGGMIHALLPKASDGGSADVPTAKFVDQGVPLLIKTVLNSGAQRSRLVAHLCGGAQMLTAPGFSNSLNIGERNAKTAEEALRAAGFRIKGQSTGGTAGRTVRLYIDSGKITVKTLGKGEKILTQPTNKAR
jgi:chemotaxis protein CheD